MIRKICLSIIFALVATWTTCFAAEAADVNGDVKADSSVKDEILFNFDKSYEADLFGSFRHISVVSNQNSVVTIRSTGQPYGNNEDPAFFLTELAIDADTHPYVVVKAKHTDLNKKELRFHYAVNGVHDAEQNLIKYLSDEYSMLVYDMEGRNGWEGTISEMYFSLNGNVIGNIDIDWIMFTDKVPEKMSSVTGTADDAKFPVVREEKMPFSDVQRGAWYYKEVETAYRLGLVNGVDETHYNPAKSVTLAEVITLAVRMNCIYNGTDEPTSDAGKWYEPYVNAAVDLKIMGKFDYPDVNIPALRGQVAYIMARALPDEIYEPINMFSEIPDMSTYENGYLETLKLYNAGIVIGSDEEYNYRAGTQITRAEIAAIVNRLARPKNRKRVVTNEEREAKKRVFTAQQIAELARFGNGEQKMLVYDEYSELAVGRGKEQDGGKADPQLNFDTLIGEFIAKDVQKIVIGLKCDNINPSNSGTLYFTTVDSPKASEDKKIIPQISEPDANGIVTLTYDVTTNIQFIGTIQNLRFDPVATYDEFGVSYVIIQ